MKKLILSLSFFLFIGGLWAQSATNEKAIQQEMETLTSLYSLDEKQAEEMLVIQQRRFRNLAQIKTLENKDEAMYLQKKKSIRMGTEASIKKMLKPEQMATFNQQVVERRKKESALVKEMRQNGASKAEIQMALLGLE